MSTREQAIEKAAAALDGEWGKPGPIERLPPLFRALRAALAQPPGPAPEMEEVERLVREYASAVIHGVHAGNWHATGPVAREAHAALLAAIRALPDRYAEGMPGKIVGAGPSEVLVIEVPGMAGARIQMSTPVIVLGLPPRSLPTPNPEDRR